MLKRQRARYPANWEAITDQVRQASGWQCQRCDRTCRRPDESIQEFARRIVGTEQPLRLSENLSTYPAALMEVMLWPGCWVLQASHIDQRPENCAPKNLRALCAPCHRSYDNLRSQVAAREFIKAEYAGQLSLF